MNTIQQQPPIILVQTWFELLQSPELAAQQHAQKMLTGAFGDMQAALHFVKKHNVEVC
jgi:hypothetical protein